MYQRQNQDDGIMLHTIERYFDKNYLNMAYQMKLDCEWWCKIL